ncbi:MAG: DUF2892 domain-containing protein [Bacteroidales bacterium]|nr:DUF2892 domain-containing protein [Bacteroidales bacterium]MBR6246731.1 DUF2892 domain-containing protein [Bacteroidales bacterium]
MKLKLSNILKYNRNELVALGLFIVGGTLGMLGLIQRVPLVLGIVGIVILASGMFYFCLSYSSESVYKNYYKDSFEIEHETIEEEIRKSMVYHRYQEAVINRYESACRDLGLSDEQKDWLLTLLMDEKNKVDEELRASGGGHI